ncbi:hypothetical protein AC578_9807 [Pseudocercospora eumusae]|nr:hypothetical protein AC578_9807 [Pseudocercospora eumusae]
MLDQSMSTMYPGKDPSVESIAIVFPDPEHGVPPTWTQALLQGLEQIAYGIKAAYLKSDTAFPMQWYTPHDCMESRKYIYHDLWRFLGANAKYRHKALEDVPQSFIAERSRHMLRIKRWKLSLDEYIKGNPIPKPEDLPSPQFPKNRMLKSINILVMWSHY